MTAAPNQVQPKAPENLPEQTAILLDVEAPMSRSAVWATALSTVVHTTLAVALAITAKTIVPKMHVPLTVKIVKVEKPKPVVAEAKKEEPKPPPPPKPKEIKKKPKKVASERRPLTPPPPAPKPVQGLSASAVVPGGKGIAAPIGNTLLTEDEGKRLKAEDVEALDQTADAQLIPGSVSTPKYTEEALDASLVGNYTVDVYVDEKGLVQQVDLRKKAGYGMDQRIIEAAQRARFTPRKERDGRPVAGWTEIRFRLEIPG